MGHRCGAVSRLFLNYDLTFLAVLLSEGGGVRNGVPPLHRASLSPAPVRAGRRGV